MGRSLGIEGNNYASQLNVTVTPDIAGKTIECLYEDGLVITHVFTLVIPTTGPFSFPSGLMFSNANYSSRIVTFLWSPVAPDCPAIHYNILASNCGSCPTTTNHTTVTCTDIPINDSVCTLSVQTVVCGNITGNTSDPITIVLYTTEPTRAPTGTIHHMDNQGTHTSDTTETPGMYNSAINTVYTISFSSATALIACVVVSIAMIVTTLKRIKTKTTTMSVQSNRTEGTEHEEPMYETITDPLPSVSAITTQDNVAYGYIKTSITAM